MARARAALSAVRERLDLPDLNDLFTFIGLGCACYGLAQIYPPAAWILGGATLFWLGALR